jgi:hypothetical protein
MKTTARRRVARQPYQVVDLLSPFKDNGTSLPQSVASFQVSSHCLLVAFILARSMPSNRYNQPPLRAALVTKTKLRPERSI